MTSITDNITFQHNNNMLPPDRSDQTKLFYDGKEFKSIGFNGLVTSLVKPYNVTELEKLVFDLQDSMAAVVPIDTTNFALVSQIPDISQLASASEIISLRDDLNYKADFNQLITATQAINSLIEAIKLENIIALEAAIKLINSTLPVQFTAQINKLEDELIKYIQNINLVLNQKANIKDLNEGLATLREIIPAEIDIEIGDISIAESNEAPYAWIRKVNNTFYVDIRFNKPGIGGGSSGGGGGSGSRFLRTLKDVDVASVTDGQILSYSAAQNKWIAINNTGSSTNPDTGSDGKVYGGRRYTDPADDGELDGGRRYL